MSGLDTLAALEARYADTGTHTALNSDLRTLIAAVRQAWEAQFAPNYIYVSATQIRIPATEDSPARVLLTGFPNILTCGGQFLPAALADGHHRQITAALTLDITNSAHLWGTEKSNQWYIVYALAADADTAFTAKLMPLMRVKSQAGQVISLGTNGTPATGIGYGFTADELVDAKIYLLNGASAGLLRVITANNNDNGTGGTITYGGNPLTVAQGDWLAVLPNTNFRFLGTVFNNGLGDIPGFFKVGRMVFGMGAGVICPLATKVYLDGYTLLSDFQSTNNGDGYEYSAGMGLG